MVICIGEILADLIGKAENGVVRFERYAGGAPFNVACDIKKLKGEAGFTGCVGDDLIGQFLQGYAEKCRFDYVNVRMDETHNTTLAFVELDPFGERKFSFYRKNTADYRLSEEDVIAAIDRADIVHLGSLMLSEESGRKIADRIVEYTKAQGKRLSFDVNYREDIFPSAEKAIAVYKKYVERADIVKFSEDELLLFADTKDFEAAFQSMRKRGRLMFVTLGKRGSIGVYNDIVCRAESISVKAVDTTGAGDAFYAGVLSKLDKEKLSGLTEEKLKRILIYGNICGALAASGYGAVDACPNGDTVTEIFNKINAEQT